MIEFRKTGDDRPDDVPLREGRMTGALPASAMYIGRRVETEMREMMSGDGQLRMQYRRRLAEVDQLIGNRWTRRLRPLTNDNLPRQDWQPADRSLDAAYHASALRHSDCSEAERMMSLPKVNVQQPRPNIRPFARR